MSNLSNDRELSLTQVATRLGISIASAYRLKDEGHVTCIRKGPKKGYVVLESELERFIQERENEAEAI